MRHRWFHDSGEPSAMPSSSPILKSAVHHRSLQPLPEQGVVEGPLLPPFRRNGAPSESLLHRDDIPAASGLIPCREAIPPPLDGIQLLDLHIAPPYRAVPFLGTYRRLMSTPSSLRSCTLRSVPGIAGETPVAAHHPMTGDDDGDGVVSHSATHRLGRHLPQAPASGPRPPPAPL